MSEEPFEAVQYLPPEVSSDGQHITVTALSGSGEKLSFRLPSPTNAQLIADLRNADALARDRYLGQKQTRSGRVARLTVREPRTVGAFRDELSGRAHVVFDHGKPTEMAFALPKGAESRLAQALLPLLRDQDPGPTKQ